MPSKSILTDANGKILIFMADCYSTVYVYVCVYLNLSIYPTFSISIPLWWTLKLSHKYCMEYNKLHHLKFKFNWTSCILAGYK